MKMKKILLVSSFVGTLVLSACGGSSHKHTWGAPSYEWADDYSSCTATRVCTKDETHVEQETVDSIYQIVTPETVTTDGEGHYVVSFTNTAFAEQTYSVTIPKDKYAQNPHLSADGKTVTYGLYPHNAINDSEIINALNNLETSEASGYYLYNGVYYAKAEGIPLYMSYTFDNGETIPMHEDIWFECKPISWIVLSNTNNKLYLLSKVLLDAHCFNSVRTERTIDDKTIYGSNYEYSDIRAWLNNEFYNSAFALGNKNIQLTTVDNSEATTASPTNPYVCNSTEDKVFLPSYKDYCNPDYGFDTSTYSAARQCMTTDFTRARGASLESQTGQYANIGSYYWTRTPYAEYSANVRNIDHKGSFANSGNRVDFTTNGVRPAIVITLE